MVSDKYENYKRKIQDRFEDACSSLNELYSCPTNIELLEKTKEKMSNLFNEMDFISANVCSLHDTDMHEVGKWFADTSKDAFYALAAFCKISRKIDKENIYTPSEKAFASMQRLITLYLPKNQVKEVKHILSDAGITITGFREKHKFRMTKSIEKLISYTSSAILVISILVIALLIPYPSPFQYTIFRIIISLASGGIAAFFSGFLTIEWSNKIKAGSGFGVFVVVYLIAPVAMQ